MSVKIRQRGLTCDTIKDSEVLLVIPSSPPPGAALYGLHLCREFASATPSELPEKGGGGGSAKELQPLSYDP